MRSYDFLLEYRLKKLNRELADQHARCMSVFEQMLKNFFAVFPHFTDHTLLHTLNVTNLANQLFRDEVEKLNADELDIASDRNSALLYNIETMEDLSEKDVFEFSKHEAIHTVEFTEDTIGYYCRNTKGPYCRWSAC